MWYSWKESICLNPLCFGGCFDDLIINFEDYKDEKIGVQGKIVSYKKAMSTQLIKETKND